MRETAGKKSLLRILQAPMGRVGSEDRRDLPLQRSPLAAPEVSCRRRLRVFCLASPGLGKNTVKLQPRRGLGVLPFRSL